MRYEFPATTGPAARDLIAKIFTDSHQRLDLRQIEGHDFFTKMPIPKRLPLSILQFRPSSRSLIDQYEQPDPVHSTKSSNGVNGLNANRQPFNALSIATTDPVRKPLISTARLNHNQPRGGHHRVQRTADTVTHCKYAVPLKGPSRAHIVCEQKDNSPPPVGSGQESSVSFIYILKHCDYSKKYGVGYLLSNGSTGVHFNDSSKITLHRDGETVTYLDDQHRARKCSLRRFPESLTKKVKLLQFFERHLKSLSPNERDQVFVDEEAVYVSSWRKERHAVVFQLQNGTVQVSFADDSLLVYHDAATVLYKDRSGGKDLYTLEQINQSQRRDLKKRYKFMKTAIAKIQRSR